MFADYLHRRIPPSESATKLSKINNSFRYTANPTLVINLTKIGSTLSPEEHRLHAWGRSASRGIHNIRNLADSSIKICKIFADLTTNEHQSTLIQGVPGSIGHWPVGFGCQPKRTFRKCP